ncbi:circularly permutated Ras protein 1-like isoform X1 [Astyanax mexicanus]|uniref:circularly permutated Ras protein 1-like isoform X1 n=1 Tax=Astyanax mexicanus TaxID=7994 RepID=UPI0020CAA5C2|nr:circularly permutated Ras protein 1-like isoform X1 [Astyanax mexicanus]
MEFACEFVYISPAKQVKRSALLPPAKDFPIKSSTATPPKPIPAPKPPVPTKPSKQCSPSPPVPTTPKPHLSTSPRNPSHTPVYENLSRTPPTPPNNTVTSPPRVWKVHLPPSAPSTTAKPIRKPQTPSNSSEPIYEPPPPDPESQASKPPTSPRNYRTSQTPAEAPPLPPRPPFLPKCPEYVLVRPVSGRDHLPASSAPATEAGESEGQLLPGNPNVLLVNLGKLVMEEPGEPVLGEPTSCFGCGSVLESSYDNMVKECYFCQSWSPAPSSPIDPPTGCEDCLFQLSPGIRGSSADSNLLIFCISTSHSMSTSAQVVKQKSATHRSRLHCVQEAVLQCVQVLSEKLPETRVGLVTFGEKVTIHGYGEVPPRVLQGGELSDKNLLEEAGLSFPTPPPLSESQANLQMEIHRLEECGASALGPAALVSITMASNHPGSKVLVCTDGVPDAGLGGLNPSLFPNRSIVSSSIFYRDLSETAAAHGVSVSVVSLEGSVCRLDELGRVTDGTGGKVVISSYDDLGEEFMRLIDDRIIATSCTVTLLFPKVLTVIGERQAGHCGIREVGNITEESQITFQYGQAAANTILQQGRSVSVQLLVRYCRWDGLSMLRVLTTNLQTTDDSSQAVCGLDLSVLMVNAGQTSAALALRGRFRDAHAERDAQKQLIHRALEYRQNTEDELMFREWIRTSDPIYNNLDIYTQSLSDADAAVMYAMKNGYYHTESYC